MDITMKKAAIKPFSKLSKKDIVTLKPRSICHKENNYYNNVDDEASVCSDDNGIKFDNESVISHHSVKKQNDVLEIESKCGDDDSKTIRKKRHSLKELLSDDDIMKGVGEQLIFDPYNALNSEITESQVQNILAKYGVPGKVHNINLYRRAFVHKSYLKRPHLINEQNNVRIVEQPNDCMRLKTKSNERLEFLGDGVLECVTKYYLYRRFPKANEGFMTEKKIALVKNEHIGKLAYDMGLNKHYIISKNAEEKKTRTNLKKLGCLFEAFIGALFLDFNKVELNDEEGWFNNVFVTGPGFQNAQIFIENVFEKHVNWSKLIQDDDNYKNILQVKIQKEFKTTPTYMIIEEDDDGYKMGVYLAINIPVQNILPENALYLDGALDFKQINTIIDEKGGILLFISEAKHKIKKKAEQQACQYALERIIDNE
jgi:dsRNA-specific ribonuclease